MLPGVLGFAGQRRLLGARVLVIGAGGLGAPVIQYLTTVDDDVVEAGEPLLGHVLVVDAWDSITRTLSLRPER